MTWPLLLLVGLVPFAALADSEDNANRNAPELRRELDGHNFLPSGFIIDPFVSTYVSSETGFGYGTASGHTFDITGNPVMSPTTRSVHLTSP